MKKIYLHFHFILIGLCIAAWSCFFADSQILNIKDAYFVIEPSVFSICILAFYTIFAVVYFLSRKYSNFFFGFLNVFLVTIPIIYFIYSNSQEEEITDVGYYLTHQSEILWKTEYIPETLIIIFLTGIVMMPVNIVLSIIKFKKSPHA